VVRKMMAKDAAQRYQTPLEVVRVLAPFAKGRLKPLPMQVAPPKAGPLVAALPPVAQPAAIEDSVTIALAVKTAGARRARKWLTVSLVVVLLAGLVGLGVALVLRPGTRKDEVAKDGIKVLGEKVEPHEGENPALRARLDPQAAAGKGNDRPPPVAGGADVVVPTITNSIGMKLVLVKPGAFLMGSPSNEAGHRDEEYQHEVEITRPFYVGVHEVTQEQYERVVGENPSWFSPTGFGKDMVKAMDTRQFPVDRVSWHDAVEFCRRLSEMPDEKVKKHAYRLPTEAEWEYVCRGGQFFKKPSPPFQFGNSLSSTEANFNGDAPYGDAPKGGCLGRPTKVGSYAANPLGLYDLHGNASEWCSDWYDVGYYKRSPRQDPQGPENGEQRVMRGGAVNMAGWNCRSASRSCNKPGTRALLSGFRVVLVSGAKPK
jgi:formylglycine-generating enzyme required for sulfatase activity